MSTLFDFLAFVAILAVTFLAIYIIYLFERVFKAYIWEDRLEIIWPSIQRVFGWIFIGFVYLSIIMLFANSCHAQEETSKEAIERWTIRMDSVDKAWKQADIQKEQGTYVPPVVEYKSKAKWIPKEQWIAKKRKEDSIALYNKVYKMSDTQFNSFADSVADYRMKKLENWKQNNPDYQYKKFQRDSLRTWKKDSTSQYWVEYKEQKANNYKAMQEVMKAERDSTSKYWEHKKLDKKRMQEAYNEAKAQDNAKWEKINKERAASKQQKEAEANKKAEYIERHTGRNQYLSDEQYYKEKAKKKN